MPHAPDRCTCWQASSETGESHTSTWLGMHERILVVLRDGQRVEGRPAGPVWFRGDADGDGQTDPYREAQLPGFDVELDDGSEFSIPLSEVVSISPLVAPDPVKILESVAHALRRPFEVEDGEIGWTAIAGPHHEVQVEVKVRRTECQAATPAPPPFRILVQNYSPG